MFINYLNYSANNKLIIALHLKSKLKDALVLMNASAQIKMAYS